MSSPSIQSGRNLRTQQQQQQEVLSDPSKYLVKSGDNLSKIAQQHGVDLQSLIAANPQIKNPDLIFPNQSINIPQAQAAEGHTPAEGATTTGGHGETLHGDGFETGGHASTGGRGITEEGQQFRESVHTDPQARAQFDTLRHQAHLGGHTVRGNQGGANTAGGEHGAHATDPHARTGGNGHAVDGHGDDHHGSHTLRNNDGRTNDLNGSLHENGGAGHAGMRGTQGDGTSMIGQSNGTATNRSASYTRGGGVVTRQTSRTEMDLNRNTQFSTGTSNSRDNTRGVTTRQTDSSFRDSQGRVDSSFSRSRQLDSGYQTRSFGGRTEQTKTLGNGNQYRVTDGNSQTTASNKDGTRSVTRESKERGAVLLNGQDNSAQRRMDQIDRKLDGFRGGSGRFKPESAAEQREIRSLQSERTQLQQQVKERNPNADAGTHKNHAHHGPAVLANANFASIEKKTAWNGLATVGKDPTFLKDQTGGAMEVHVLAARGSAGAAAGMSLKTGQLHAGAQAGVEVDLLGASGRAQVGTANSAQGQAYVRGAAGYGANASAGGSVNIDPRNLTAKIGVGAEAFAGGQVRGAVGYQNRYVGAEVEGRLQKGAGFAARAEVGMERGVFKARADLGACVGLGGRVTVNLNVNVGAIYKDSKAAVGSAVSSGWNTVKGWF